MKKLYLFVCILACLSSIYADDVHTYSIELSDEVIKNLSMKKSEQCRLAKYKKLLPTDITYLAVDIKYDGNQLKVLEFQDGPTAGFRAYDDVVKNRGEIWHIFWQHMAMYKLPIWYLGPQPKSYKPGTFSQNDKQRMRFDEFLKMGGLYVASWNDLVRDHDFLAAESRGVSSHCGKRRVALNDYKGIVLAKLCGQNYKIATFRREHPDFLVINEKARKSLYDKRRVHALFNKIGLNEFRPWSKIFPKKYTPRLARSIIKEHPSDFYVIKPLNSSRSNGVIVVSKRNLNVALKKLFGTRSLDELKLRSYRPKKTQVYSYWRGDTNKSFMIEEYVPSKSLSLGEDTYDPTGRVVFVASHSAGTVKFTFIKGFWKIPPNPLGGAGTLTNKHVSKHFEGIFDLPSDMVCINQSDMMGIESLLVKSMLPMYTAILLGR